MALGRLAQLARALPSHGRGRWFKSNIAHNYLVDNRTCLTLESEFLCKGAQTIEGLDNFADSCGEGKEALFERVKGAGYLPLPASCYFPAGPHNRWLPACSTYPAVPPGETVG